jgi:two-component system sensor histidine kinase AlgZ
MHPIAASRQRMVVYALAWLWIWATLAYITAATGGMSWLKAAAVLAPACFVFWFVCLSPWYLCRARPLGGVALPGSVAVFAGTAGVAGGLLAGIAGVAGAVMQIPIAAGQGALWFAAGTLLYLLSTGLHYAVLGVMRASEAEQRAAEARMLAREAQLQALKFQLNPHFLFNSLHSIAALATLDGGRAREMCVRLASFLRRSLGLGDREVIPLREELALAQSYLEVEQVRFGDRLRVETDVENGCEDCAVPALLLQPLVENAIKHGVAGMVEPGSIRLAARRSGPDVAITLENAFDPDSTAPAKLGIGLTHVRRRLEVRYGDGASFQAGPEDHVYRVMLRLPCEPSIASMSRA